MVMTRVWKKFGEIHFAITLTRPIAICSARVCMLHASKTCPLTKPNLKCLQHNNITEISNQTTWPQYVQVDY